MSTVKTVRIDQLVRRDDLTPREGIDPKRVAVFAQQLGALPPIEFVVLPDGSYVLVDGWHRTAAYESVGLESLPAVEVPVPEGEDPERFAYGYALKTAVVVARPLTNAEKRAAVLRLLADEPTLADREIGRRLSVDHKFVGKLRNAQNPTATPRGKGGRQAASPMRRLVQAALALDDVDGRELLRELTRLEPHEAATARRVLIGSALAVGMTQ